MKVKVNYTVYKTMEIEIPDALGDAYKEAREIGDIEYEESYDDIMEYICEYIHEEENGEEDIICDWDEVES